MYSVEQSFSDLEVGQTILWNGDERTVKEVTEDGATIGSMTLSKSDIDSYLKSHDCPFEIKSP